MDESTLLKANAVMVDKIALVYCMAMGLICQQCGIPYPEAMILVHGCGAMLGCMPRDIEAVSYAMGEIAKDSSFLEKHKASEQQILDAMFPNRKANG